jgi:hypothetical protein
MYRKKGWGNDSMNWSDIAKVVVGGILTLSGGVLAVWVSSRLSGRQTRWTQKRDVYGRLLETLGEDSHTLTMLSNLETWPPSHTLSEELRAYQKSEIEQLQKRHNDLTRELYRVSSLARLFVSGAALAVLHGISIPSYEDNLDMPIDDRRDNLEGITRKIVSVAREDLGFRRS